MYRRRSAATSGSESVSSLGLWRPDQPEQACFSRKLSRCTTSEQETFCAGFCLLRLSFPRKMHARTHARKHAHTHPNLTLLRCTVHISRFAALPSGQSAALCLVITCRGRRDAEPVKASPVIHSANSLTFGAANDDGAFFTAPGKRQQDGNFHFSGECREAGKL